MGAVTQWGILSAAARPRTCEESPAPPTDGFPFMLDDIKEQRQVAAVVMVIMKTLTGARIPF